MKLKMLFASTLFSLGVIGTAFGEPAIIYDLKCSGSQAYIALAKEFLERGKINGSK